MLQTHSRPSETEDTARHGQERGYRQGYRGHKTLALWLAGAVAGQENGQAYHTHPWGCGDLFKCIAGQAKQKIRQGMARKVVEQQARQGYRGHKTLALWLATAVANQGNRQAYHTHQGGCEDLFRCIAGQAKQKARQGMARNDRGTCNTKPLPCG